MNHVRMCITILGIASGITFSAASLRAEVTGTNELERTTAMNLMPPDTPAVQLAPIAVSEPPEFLERDLSGPRVGFMVSTSDGELSRRLEKNGMGRMVSLFGWHFENRITPLGGGPQFLTQVVPLVGGVEYGKFLPSVTLALGVRLQSGYEFGVGPSIAASGSGGALSSGIVMSAGRSIDYSGVNVPLNLAVSLNQKGTVVSMVAGYAVHRAPR